MECLQDDCLPGSGHIQQLRRAAACLQTLVQTVLDILGLSANAVGLHTSLAALGLDSMQVVNVRSAVQLALNVSYPLSEVGSPHPPWHGAQSCCWPGYWGRPAALLHPSHRVAVTWTMWCAGSAASFNL